LNQEEVDIISLKDDSSADEICDLVSNNAYKGIKSFVEIKDGENIKTIRLHSSFNVIT
jgi:hypothetical protein